MSLTKTTGVVLRGTNFKEADRILEIYSDQLGKVRAVAKGVRKIKSRLAGHLEPFTYVDLMLAQGRGDLAAVTGAKAIEHYAGLRRNLKAVAAASYLAELVGRLTPDGQASRRFPTLLRAALRALDAGHDPRRVVSYYEWQAVGVAGWEPSLRSCASCHEPLFPGGLSFSVGLDGVLCKGCHVHDPSGRAVSAEAVKLLRQFAERPFTEVEGLLVGDGVRAEAAALTELVVHITLEREPKSRSFLRHVETV